MEAKQLLIDGNWIPAEEGKTIPVIDPSTGQEMGAIARGAEKDVHHAVLAAQGAMEGTWGNLTAVERGRLIAKLGQLILENKDELTQIESRDVGKPLKQAANDVIACARYCEFYAGAVDKIHGETIPYLEGYTVLTLREAHGVTGHIIPWNYPLQIIGRSVIGALTMGNATVIKPGEDASLSALFLGNLAMQAGFPAGSLNIVTGYGEEAGAALSRHSGLDHISFTGSPRVGTLVQQAAAVNIIPVTLELGGKSPQLVFADADLEKALPFVTNAAVQNAGQTCSAGSRVLIEESIYEPFIEMLAARFSALRVGPSQKDYDVGPLINQTQYKRVNRYMEQAKGLEILAQGEVIPDAPAGGFYVQPTLLGRVPAEHQLAKEEIFGPVLVCISFKDEEEAIAIANNTDYGLVAGIWTADGGRQMRVAKAIKSGQIFINNYGAGGGVELPFGGMKGSGFGREKGFEALYGFSVLKTIAMHHG
ncbi:MAG: aldehyde dehydrogenase family protein [SAR324 cluster bacterium]|nr:aldehyde dehydrogenase family protein [SAR324 cluster bacterium]